MTREAIRGVPGLGVNQSDRLRDQSGRVLQSANVLFGFEHLIAAARRETFGTLDLVYGHGLAFFLWKPQTPEPAIVSRAQLVRLGTDGAVAARRGQFDVVFSLTTATVYGPVEWVKGYTARSWQTNSPVVAWSRFAPSPN